MNTLSFEIKRVFQVKNLPALVLFLGICWYVVYFGVAKYKDFLEEKKDFLRCEGLKIAQYLNYQQYGSFGFRVMTQPSPLVVFFHSYWKPLESNIDVKDIVNITSDHKGRKLFVNNGPSGDFAAVIFVLGSLIMLYFGVDTLVSFEILRFHSGIKYACAAIGARFLILMGYFGVVVLSVFSLAWILGVFLAPGVTGIFFMYSLYLAAFLAFFYFLGILLTVILRFKRRLLMGAYLVWFVIIFVIPLFYHLELEKRAKHIDSDEIVNIEKLKNGKDVERKAEVYFKDLQEKKIKEIRAELKKFVDEYVDKVIPLNTRIENSLNREVKELITHHEKKSIFFPSAFYGFLAKEVSSTGYYGYQDFLAHILGLKEEFYHFYFDKRYIQVDQSVEAFPRGSANVFLSTGLLPANYWKGFSVTCFYSFLSLGGALGLLFWKLRPQRRVHPTVQLDIDQLEMSKTYFYLSRNVDPGQKQAMLDYLKSQQGVLIEKPDFLYDPGVSLKAWVRFEARQKQLDPVILDDYLEILGITQDQSRQRIKNLDLEVFYAAYLGIQLAQKTALYVFDDFLNRVSREFEQTFKEVVDKLLPQAVIIYLGSQMFDITVKDKAKSPFSFGSHREVSRFVAVDLNDITLR